MSKVSSLNEKTARQLRLSTFHDDLTFSIATHQFKARKLQYLIARGYTMKILKDPEVQEALNPSPANLARVRRVEARKDDIISRKVGLFESREISEEMSKRQWQKRPNSCPNPIRKRLGEIKAHSPSPASSPREKSCRPQINYVLASRPAASSQEKSRRQINYVLVRSSRERERPTTAPSKRRKRRHSMDYLQWAKGHPWLLYIITIHIDFTIWSDAR